MNEVVNNINSTDSTIYIGESQQIHTHTPCIGYNKERGPTGEKNWPKFSQWLGFLDI